MILHPELPFLLKDVHYGWNKTLKNFVSNINHSVNIEYFQK